MQVGLTGSLPSFALTSADEAKSVAAARLPDTDSTTLPALEQLDVAQRSGTDERRDADARRQQQAPESEIRSSTSAQEEQKAQTQERIEQRRGKELEQAETAEIQDLARRDREVRAHEQAHQSVGASYAGGASYSFTTGPNGVRYAISGEVSIDMSKVPGNPQATLQKASTVQRAALAPADPSSQDRQVAAQAVQLALEARSDIQLRQRQEASGRENASANEPQADSNTGAEGAGAVDDTNKAANADNTSDEDSETTTALAEATARLIELNEDLSRIYEKLIEAQNFEQTSSISQLLDIDA